MKLSALISVLFVGALWFFSAKTSYEFPRPQISGHEWSGDIGMAFVEVLCEGVGRDPNDGFVISCPKCRDLHIWGYPEGPLTIASFFCDTTVEPSTITCLPCGYPLGTDWDIFN